ncbi:LuxR family transcriptional regulator [Thermococcus sp. Bubb.Bath]|uniref:LuxR family transcriptional regulator n=1 Tax=Thermococcus sp. Bubb.Bath TaxID=1638242 RepID=UPI00143A0DCC|nr:LuxR family transcriptional regulator [Thermococcus sp. Bubb.Bath]NJF24928.1 LuxR family transcriptional regulator [Thermococcus sp. Bubb.Bath]
MKPIPFLAALLVLVAMTMPWFTADNTQGMGVLSASKQDNGELSLWSIAEKVYSNPLAIKESAVKTLQVESVSSVESILPIIGIPLVILGAVVGLFKGRIGHGVGLLGMVLLTLPMVYSPGAGIRGSLTVGVGYVLAWVGFSIGLISALASK